MSVSAGIYPRPVNEGPLTLLRVKLAWCEAFHPRECRTCYQRGVRRYHMSMAQGEKSMLLEAIDAMSPYLQAGGKYTHLMMPEGPKRLVAGNPVVLR